MKLEPKYLAGYLPYGLEGICHTGYNGGLDVKQEVIGLGNSYVTYRNTCYQCVDVQLLNFKPILRPLSDLKKEIEVNGEKFVPIDKMESLGWFNMNCINKDKVLRIPFGMMQFLLEWHFDIYGLIEEDLAIDINTL